MSHDKREEFWKARAKNYEKLEWAIKGGYLHAVLDSGQFASNDLVLDIGTGTGIIAQTISPFVDKVYAVDISDEMLSHALKHQNHNERFVKSDACALSFASGSFGKLTARMVFHHIVENTQKAMNECYRVLKNGGKMIFSEGVPPSQHVKHFYTEMFKLKEDRVTFMDSDLIFLMRNAGFDEITEIIYWSRNSSIKNWLENSGIAKKNQDKIFKMHLDMDEKGKKDYNMVLKDGDCFIDMKFVILVGSKN